MAFRLGGSLFRPWLLRTLAADVRVALRLLREPRVPLLVKAVPFLGVLYVLSPVDLLPDFMPLAGQLDDLTIAFIALKTFLSLCPGAATEHHRAAATRGEGYAPVRDSDLVIDADYKRE